MFTDLIFSLSDISNNIPTEMALGFNLPYFEAQLQLLMPEPTDTAICLDSMLTSLGANTIGTISIPDPCHSNANGIVAAPTSVRSPDAGMMGAMGHLHLAATESEALVSLNTPPVQSQPEDSQVRFLEAPSTAKRRNTSARIRTAATLDLVQASSAGTT
jgi:hypothetical protein